MDRRVSVLVDAVEEVWVTLAYCVDSLFECLGINGESEGANLDKTVKGAHLWMFIRVVRVRSFLSRLFVSLL